MQVDQQRFLDFHLISGDERTPYFHILGIDYVLLRIESGDSFAKLIITF